MQGRSYEQRGSCVGAGASRAVPLGHLLAVLFAATALNYVDRQIIGILEPQLARQLHWSATDYANIIFWFQVAYAAGYVTFGKLIDKMGARLRVRRRGRYPGQWHMLRARVGEAR